MDFNLTEDHQLIRKMVRDFAEREIKPIAKELDEKEEFSLETSKKIGELGLFGIYLPEKYGGQNLDTICYIIAVEELARVDGSHAATLAAHNSLGINPLYKYGNEEQKMKYLPKLCTGDALWSFGLTEPEAGSDAANIKTTAERRDDHWVLNGRKHFITNGDIAQLITTMAVTDKSKGSRGGITAFLVEKDMPGFSVGTIEKKMGLSGSNTAELLFDECLVPKENVIGGGTMLGQGFKTAMRVIDKGRLTIGAAAVGASQKLLDMCVDYAKQRIQFGKPIGQFQMIQAMLADMATEIHAARQMLYNGAWLRDQGKRITREAAMAKLFCTEMASRIADKAIQIHGGMGYMKELPVEMFYRDVRLYRIFEGTSEIQRLVIARDLLKE